MANNKQFSVMVDSGGILSYPQNFITANSLAKFGSDVNGTFNHLTTTRIEAESKTFGMATVGIDFIPAEMTNGEYIYSKILFDCGGDTGVGYAFPLLSISRPETLIKGSDVINLQSSKYDSHYGTSISVKASELSLEHNNKIKSKDGDSSNCITLNDTGIDVGISYSYLLDDGFSSTAGKNNILINIDKITVSAPLVELPENTTIGGKTIASLAGTPSNMVTTDTEQTITGKKSFTNISLPDTLPVYDLVQNVRFYDGDLTTSSIHLGYNYSEINAKNEGLIFNCTQVTFYDSTGNNSLMTVGADKVSFYVPQYLRVFNTVTKTWTNTYKYTYLAQDANGNVTLAISDTHPTA